MTHVARICRSVFVCILTTLWVSQAAALANDPNNPEKGLAAFLGCGTPFNDDASVGDESDAEDGTAPDNDGDEAEAGESVPGLTLIDCSKVRLVAKNITQESEDGDSNFGVGLDWDYKVAKTWDNAFTPTLSAAGQGFVSLGDANDSRGEADDTSNFNSIVNQGRFSAQGVHSPDLEKASPPPADPSLRKAWAEAQRTLVRRNALSQATGYIALDAGFHARTETNQSFRDTQVALGGGLTLASGLISRWLLMPLGYLVPQRDEYGAFVQSPLLFVAIDEVLGADHREAIDNSDDNDFERFRLELAWTSELILSGLYPFVHFQYFQELGADSEVKDAGKDSTTFVEGGARYYVGSVFEGVRRFAGGTGGPFITLKYATGALPPYLESDHQASVGLGFSF